jgi:anti-sigma factor RsiW
VALDRRINADLAQLFGAADEPIPARLLASAIVRPRPPYRMLAAASIVLLLLGASAGWLVRDRQAPVVAAASAPAAPASTLVSLPREAATAHRVFTVEVRHPVEVTAKEEAHLVAWLSKRLGQPINAPNLEDMGYALVGGRLLSCSSGPAAQFMYEAKGGERLTLYVARNLEGNDTAFRFAAEGEAGVFYWIDGPMGYAIIGPADRARLLPIASAVHQRLGG